MPEILIRNEVENDFREVEELTRKAFWNVYVPGCVEHYLAHILRSHKDFIPELDFVAETGDGKIVGNLMYTKAWLTDENGCERTILTFGPISVHPDYQRMGISRKLLEHSFERASALGYEAVVILGNPGNYVGRGFKSCRKYHVCMEDNSYPTAMLVKELVKGAFADGRNGYIMEVRLMSLTVLMQKYLTSSLNRWKKKFVPARRNFIFIAIRL